MTDEEKSLVDALKANIEGKEKHIEQYRAERLKMAQEIIHWKTLAWKLGQELMSDERGKV